MFPLPVALQLYSIRETLATGYEAGVRQVAAMGYAGVETAGFPGTTAHAAGQLFRALGLTVCASHGDLPLGDNKNKVLDMLAEIGSPRIVQAWLPPERFTSLDSIYEAADTLNAAAEAAASQGVSVGYHNHWQEFAVVEGRPAYEHMLERLDPRVFWELDTYWAKVAQHEPAEMIRKLGERGALLHIKDGPLSMSDPMTAVGEGQMNWPPILEAGEAHAQWLIVEIDRSAGDMLTDVAQSYRYLVTKGWGHGASA
jgi:sugar phosphate isomerase/epimerase